MAVRSPARVWLMKGSWRPGLRLRNNWARVFTSPGVDDLRVQLTDCAAARPAFLRFYARLVLAENELAAGSIVAEIEPIRCAVPGLVSAPLDNASRRFGCLRRQSECRRVVVVLHRAFRS